ncbi:hypothetical protein [Caudoviricetes sp.]|nr:hypothetical protein [Caudoviricetes sp.]
MTRQAANKVGHRVACVYETENRQQCAAGCLIKTKWQRLDLNASGSVKLHWFYGSGLSYELISRLQAIHDNCFHWNKTGLNRSGYDALLLTA